jgi:hypothetical protein
MYNTTNYTFSNKNFNEININLINCFKDKKEKKDTITKIIKNYNKNNNNLIVSNNFDKNIGNYGDTVSKHNLYRSKY